MSRDPPIMCQTDSDVVMAAAEDYSTESGDGKCSSGCSAGDQDTLQAGWVGWNSLRLSLALDHLVGICLVVDHNPEND